MKWHLDKISSMYMKIAEKVAAIKQCSIKLIILLIISDINSEITDTMPPCNQITFLQLPTGVRKSVHYRMLSFAYLTTRKQSRSWHVASVSSRRNFRSQNLLCSARVICWSQASFVDLGESGLSLLWSQKRAPISSAPRHSPCSPLCDR